MSSGAPRSTADGSEITWGKTIDGDGWRSANIGAPSDAEAPDFAELTNLAATYWPADPKSPYQSSGRTSTVKK